MSVAIAAALLLAASGQADPPAQQPAAARPPVVQQPAGGVQPTAPPTPATEAGSTAPASETTVLAGDGVTPYPAAFFAASAPSNATEMLDRVPGFLLDTGDNVRGFAGAAGNVLIDGVRPSVKGDELFNLIRRIPASNVERIDLIRGGAPGIDMQGKPVVANIVRRAGGGSTGLLAFAFNLSEDGRFSPALRMEGSRRGAGYNVEGSLLLFAGENIDDAGDGEQTRRNAVGDLLLTGPYSNDVTYDGIELRGSGELRRPSLGTFKLNGNYQLVNEDAHERVDFLDGLGRDVGFDRSTYAFHRDRGQLGGDWARPLGGGRTLTIVALQSLQREQFDARSDGRGDDNRFIDDTTSGESILRGTLGWVRSPSLSFEVGAEGAYNFLDGDTALFVNSQPIELPSSTVLVEEVRGEAFATTTWRPTPRWSVEAGARVESSRISQSGDADQERTFTFVKPRLNLAYSPDADSQIRLRLEREVGQLDFGDFVSSASVSDETVNAGNPDLEPERAWVAELALERRFWGRGSAVLTLSHAEVQQVADLIPIGGRFDAPGNIGDGTRDLAKINLTLPLDRLRVPGGLFTLETQWRRSEVTDPVTGEERRISGQSPTRWEAHYTQDIPRWNLTYGVDLFGGFEEVIYRINEIRRIEYDTFVTTFVEYRPRPYLQLRLELQNITGRERTRLREFFDGPRGAGRLSGTEFREVDAPTSLYFRIRRTL